MVQLAVVVFLGATDVFLVTRLLSMGRELSASFARERVMIDDNLKLTATLNQTTGNLELQNAAVHELLAEKRAAWGLTNVP